MPYGSEWHLLRYLGRHRQRFHERVHVATGGNVLNWLDHAPNPSGRPVYFDGPNLDAEWKGLDFLTGDVSARLEWPGFWPQSGNVPNWDAVGWIQVGTQVDLLLVEAKAHLAELRSSCGAAEHGGLPRIREALNQAKQGFGVFAEADWLQPYYQFCNRLTVLHFLMQHGVGVRLLFVYFYGDSIPSVSSPMAAAAWEPSLQAMNSHVGLNGHSALEGRVHKLFLPVSTGSL